MRVFVTGATGLLGNNTVRTLEAGGHEVVALVRSRDKAKILLRGTRAEIVTGDMRDVAALERFLAGCDAVIHTAAYFREYYAPGEHAGALEEINVGGSLALLDSADRHGVRRFVHVSSSGVIGHKSDGSPGDEDTPASAEQLRNLYFRSKVQGDAKIRAFTPRQRLEVVTIHPGWMFGPGDAGPTSAGKLCLDLVARKLPGVPPGGACVVDARDVAFALGGALEIGRHGDRYIVAGEPRTLREILDAAADAASLPRLRLDIPTPFAILAAHGSEMFARITGGAPSIPLEGVRALLGRHYVSSARAVRELGVSFRSLDDTMRATIGWYRDEGYFERARGREQPSAVA